MSVAWTSELRRLAFGFEKDIVGEGQMQVAYHLSLSRFLLRSLADLYPALPVGKFSEAAVFSVKDEVRRSGAGVPSRTAPLFPLRRSLIPHRRCFFIFPRRP